MANLLMLICELVDRHYLERNPFLGSAQDGEVALLATIINNCTTATQNYLQRGRVHPSKNQGYAEVGICLFCEAILNEFLTDYDSSGPFRIKKKLYLMMVLGDRFGDSGVVE